MTVRLNEAWVVFDGTESDSKVIGLAATLEGAIRMLNGTVTIDRKTLRIELPYSDAAVIKAVAAPLYESARSWTPREWAIRKEDIYA